MTTPKEVGALARKSRASTKRAQDDLEARDRAVRRMRSEGATLRAIAEAAGLTHTAVANILKKESTSLIGAALEEYNRRMAPFTKEAK